MIRRFTLEDPPALPWPGYASRYFAKPDNTLPKADTILDRYVEVSGAKRPTKNAPPRLLPGP